MKIKNKNTFYTMIVIIMLLAVGLMWGWAPSVYALAETPTETVTEVVIDPNYTYYIKVDNNQKFVWLGEDGETSSDTSIEYGKSFDTMTDLKEEYEDDSDRPQKEGHIFAHFVFADGDMQGQEVQLYSDFNSYGINTPVKIYAAYTKEYGFWIYWTETWTNTSGSFEKAYDEDITDELSNILANSNYILTGWKISDDPNNQVFAGTDLAIGKDFDAEKMPDLSVNQERNGGLLVIETTIMHSNVALQTAYGMVSPTSVKVPYGASFSLPVPSEVPGREFLGWCYSSGMRSAIPIPESLVTDGSGHGLSTWNYIDDVVLAAAWHTIGYKITYDLNGGSYPEGVTNANWYMVDDEVILNNPERAHYNFVGWKDVDTGIISSQTVIPQGTVGDKHYEAVWEVEPVEYTLTFTANNLSIGHMVIDGVYETINAKYDEIIVLPQVASGGFILKSGSTYYEQGSQFTVKGNQTFELVPKNREQLHNNATGYYEIWTYENLNNMVRTYPGSKYKMMTYITLPEDVNWVPITKFTGTFDGNGFTINDLIIQYGIAGANTTVTRANYGLFEENTGTIKNLNISQGGFGLYKYTASYSNVPVYCGFIAAKNSGTISYCRVSGSFFDFAYIAPYVQSVSGAICGYNTGRVEYCEVFETGVQLTTGFGGGIVGHNKGGVITHCEIALSNVSCYQEFENDTENGYSSGHYGAVGGIVGYAEGGTISYCDVASDVDIDYNGYSSDSRTLAPELGIIAGRSTSSTTYISNVANGTTGAINGLNVITWTTGALWWKETYTWDQAQYVGGTVGRYV